MCSSCSDFDNYDDDCEAFRRNKSFERKTPRGYKDDTVASRQERWLSKAEYRVLARAIEKFEGLTFTKADANPTGWSSSDPAQRKDYLEYQTAVNLLIHSEFFIKEGRRWKINTPAAMKKVPNLYKKKAA